MAEVVQERLAKKVDDAAGRLKKRRDRKGMWDEVNGSVNKFDMLKSLEVDEEKNENEGEWVDEEMDQDEEVAASKPIEVENLPAMADTKLVVVDRTAATPTADEDEVDKIT